ncbi:RNase P subunit p30, partial [Blyttiomyces helicus]
NAILSTYDLLAVQPTTEKLFQAACKTYEVDIISLDMGSRLPFYLKQPMVNLAISRGLYFEICYGPAIRDQSTRRHLISNAAALIRVTKGKNVIISSEALKAMEVRGPYDVINLYVLCLPPPPPRAPGMGFDNRN